MTWKDPTALPPHDTINVVQRRICFTELSPADLPGHAKLFGEFSIEFEIEALRSLGALPVVYIPDRLDDSTSLDVVGTSILAHLTAAADVFNYLTQTALLDGPTIWINLQMKDGEQVEVDFDTHQTSAIKTYLNLAEKAQGIRFLEIRNALQCMSSLFYPTENRKYPGILGYYRQREWRIFSGPFISGEPTTTQSTERQAAELLELDLDFFSREIQFADGLHSLAVKSHFLRSVGGKHVLSFARRLLVPEDCKDIASNILADNAIDLPVECSP